MKSRWITHGKQKVFYYDYKDFGPDANGMIAEIDEVEVAIRQEPKKSLLILIDVRDSMITREVGTRITKNSQYTKAYARKVAVVGVTGVTRAFAATISRLTRGTPESFFDDVEEALDWLVEPA